MIHYHGGPITPKEAAIAVWARRHACISFAHPAQTALAMEICQSVMFDNGAYSVWKRGGELDLEGYAEWIAEWWAHPSFDFYIIPDVIGGSEADNIQMTAEWARFKGRLGKACGVPVWHLHESLERLAYLCTAYDRVAFGSSGEWSDPGEDKWWHRMGEALNHVCVDGRPPCKLHGLRMLDPTITSQIPFSSADSTNVAINIGYDKRWSGPYQPLTPGDRAVVLASRIEHHATAARWTQSYGTQKNLELVG